MSVSFGQILQSKYIPVSHLESIVPIARVLGIELEGKGWGFQKLACKCDFSLPVFRIIFLPSLKHKPPVVCNVEEGQSQSCVGWSRGPETQAFLNSSSNNSPDFHRTLILPFGGTWGS